MTYRTCYARAASIHLPFIIDGVKNFNIAINACIHSRSTLSERDIKYFNLRPDIFPTDSPPPPPREITFKSRTTQISARLAKRNHLSFILYVQTISRHKSAQQKGNFYFAEWLCVVIVLHKSRRKPQIKASFAYMRSVQDKNILLYREF